MDGARLVPDLSRSVFAGRFLIEELIGAGTGGTTVWSAFSLAAQRRVALKLLGSTDASDLRRFERGARISKLQRNPHTATFFEHGREGEQSFLAMELLEGETLQSRFTAERPASTAETAHIADQVLDVLGAVHAQGIVHRDIKLSNLFATCTGGDPLFIKVLDFGIATWHPERDGRGDSAADAPLGAEATRPAGETRQIVGTPEGMAPEQILGGDLDGRADLYALGIVMYQLLAGTHPFPARTRAEMYRAHLQGPLPPSLPGVSDALYAVVRGALAKRPADRWKDADAMRSALRAAMAAPPPVVNCEAQLPPASAMRARSGSDLVRHPDGARRLRPTTPQSAGAAIAMLLAVGVGVLVLSGSCGDDRGPTSVAAQSVERAADHAAPWGVAWPERAATDGAPLARAAPLVEGPTRLTCAWRAALAHIAVHGAWAI